MDIPLATNYIGIQIGFGGYRRKSSTFCPTTDVVECFALISYVVLKSCKTFSYSTTYKTILAQLIDKYPHKLLKTIYLILSRAFIVITILSSPLNLYSQTKEERDSANYDDIQKEMLRPEYINVSLIVAAPGHELYSAAGHAALRLECPSKQVDYCYEFDTDVNLGEMLDYVNGNMKASLHRLYTSSFIKRYKENNRGITGILLNLTPKQKTYLWSILDKESDSESKHDFNFMGNNCSSVARIFIEYALEEEIIRYENVDNRLTGTFRETIPYVFEASPWAQFFWNIMMGTGFDDRPNFYSNLFPRALLDEWLKAVIVSKDGSLRPMVTIHYDLFETDNNSFFSLSPLVTIFGLLLLSIVSTIHQISNNSSIWGTLTDSILMSVETLIGLFVSYLLLFSHQMATSWNWLIVIFSPIPFIAWLILRKNTRLMKYIYCLFAFVVLFFLLFKQSIPQMRYGHMTMLLSVFELRILANWYFIHKQLLLTKKTKL